ncbi:MAG TPA: NUDIX domain-containing protein [Acidimicrobiales bacterium]|nr:NUDIX domain-containing protein [Acidimicrobiales bacterium]
MDGDGFVTLTDGSVRWGIYGAAGVLVRAGERVFVAQRSLHCHQGGTWAIPGGALRSDESPLEGALREFAEEIGVALSADDCRIDVVHEDDHGGWSYWTVVVDIDEEFTPPTQLHWETAATAWVTLEELAQLEMHAGFAATVRRLGIVSD